MKCVTCGAALAPGVDECEHCETLNDTDFRLLGQARVGAAVREDSEEGQCPRCRTSLVSLKIQMGQSYLVHRCKACLGTFFSSQDLHQLVRSAAQDNSLDRERLAQLCRESPREIWPITYIPCPDCGQTMLREMYGKTSGVVCDRCHDHGVWLDGGELGRLLSWARAGGAGGGHDSSSEEPGDDAGAESNGVTRNPYEELLTRFYQAFQQKDHRTMAACYHPEVRFGDPAFPHLVGWRASAMWMMLCERGKDLKLQFRKVRASQVEGTAIWEAHYTFGKTGRSVHNLVYASFKFKDGLILEHTDSFDVQRWMGMALGFKGKLLALIPGGHKLVQKTARDGLARFIAARKLTARDFPNGNYTSLLS